MENVKITRKHIELALQYCIEKWGRSKYNGKPPKLRVFSPTNQRNPDWVCGRYNPYPNQLSIYLNVKEHKKLIKLCSTVIHEFTHYLQCMRKYKKYAHVLKYSYDAHPYEKTARIREKKFRRECKKYVLKNLY